MVQGAMPFIFVLPSPSGTGAVGATNPSAHALSLSEHGGKLRAQAEWAAPSIPSSQAMAPRSCCCHLLPFLSLHWGQTCTWLLTPRSLQTSQRQHPPESKVSTGNSLPCQLMSAASLRPALPVSHLWLSLQQCPDARTARGFFCFSWKSPSFCLGVAFSDHSRQQNADSSLWCELSPVSPASSSQKISSSVL